MSAHAYIQYADVPEPLLESARRTIDGVTGAALIQFDGYPHSGELVDGLPCLHVRGVEVGLVEEQHAQHVVVGSRRRRRGGTGDQRQCDG